MSTPKHCNMPAHAIKAVLLAAIVAQAAHGETVNSKLHFDIPAQSLNQALLAFGKQSRQQLMYSTDIAENLHSHALQGDYTATEAINMLLSDSPLQTVTTRDGTITLQPKAKDMQNKTDPKVLAPVNVVGKTNMQDNDPYNTNYNRKNASTATKTDTPLMETAANIQVVPKSVLNDQQALNLNRALTNVAGAFTTQGAGGLNDQIFIRGFQNPQQFRNGFRFNSRGGQVGTREMANVERIEVLKGSNSALYGQSWEPFMVNVVTKQPLATPYYSLQQQFGSFDLYRTSMDATGPLTKDDTLLYRFNASYQNSGSFRELVDSERVFLAPIVKWNINPRTQATLEMEYRHDNLVYDPQILPFVNGSFINIPNNRNLTERLSNKVEDIFLGFNWSHQFNDDWKLSQQFATDLLERPELFSVQGNGATLTNGNLLQRTLAGGARQDNTYYTDINLTGHFNTIGLKHTLLLGGDYYRADYFSDNFNTVALPGINVFDPIHAGITNSLQMTSKTQDVTDFYGIYGQDQIKLPFGFNVNGGLRYQYIHNKNINTPIANNLSTQTAYTLDAVTPSVGVLWQAKDWLSLYGNYVENFGRANSIDFSGKYLPPQTTQQYELGAKTEFFDGRLSASLTYFDVTKQNVATRDLDPTHICSGGFCSVAAGEVRSRGPELDIRGEILPGWSGIVTYTNLDTRITKDNNPANLGNRLYAVPRNMGSLWNTYDFQQAQLKGLKIGGGVTLRDGSTDGTKDGYQTAGFATVDLLAAYSLKVGRSKITAQLNVNNLLDKGYITDAVFSSGASTRVTNGTPRSFMGSIRMEF